MIEKAFAKSASPVFLGFLKVVARHGRLDMLRLIHLTAHEECSKALGRVRVMVSTACGPGCPMAATGTGCSDGTPLRTIDTRAGSQP